MPTEPNNALSIDFRLGRSARRNSSARIKANKAGLILRTARFIGPILRALPADIKRQ